MNTLAWIVAGGVAMSLIAMAGSLTLLLPKETLDRLLLPMVAFAGGEPTLSKDLEPVLMRCKQYGIHTSIATHGGLLTPERCQRLAQCGLRYVEVSLDSVELKVDLIDGYLRVGMWREAELELASLDDFIASVDSSSFVRALSERL